MAFENTITVRFRWRRYVRYVTPLLIAKIKAWPWIIVRVYARTFHEATASVARNTSAEIRATHWKDKLNNDNKSPVLAE